MKHAIQFGRRELSLNVPDDRVTGVLAPKPVKELKSLALNVELIKKEKVSDESMVKENIANIP